jgi:hypothetical protein
MNQTSLVRMELPNMVQFSFIFWKKIWGSFLCCPNCPQMKRILLITITPIIKVQILCGMACWKALWIFHLPKKFQNIQWQIGIMDVCPKSLNSIYGSHCPLGVKFFHCKQVFSMQSFVIKVHSAWHYDCVLAHLYNH